MNIKSKFINNYSKLMLGIYMIHEQNYVRGKIYTWLGIVDGNHNSYKFILYVFLVAFVIFIACSIIEFIRQKIFLFFYNRKISKTIREKYYLWIDKLKNINYLK